jgi:hypothetical protein
VLCKRRAFQLTLAIEAKSTHGTVGDVLNAHQVFEVVESVDAGECLTSRIFSKSDQLRRPLAPIA